MLHHADAQGVDQGIALVAGVEYGLAADVRQAEAVPVTPDARDDAGQHPLGVGVVGGAETQRVHHGDGTGAHGEDVADDAPDAGGRALVGLDVAGVVVRLDLEGDRVVLADVDDAGVLADADQQGVGLRGLLAELLQVHLAALVRAVLRPHHRVHGQLGAGRPAAEDLPDARVLVLLEAEFGPRLGGHGGVGRVLDGVEHGALCGLMRGRRHAVTSLLSAEVKKPSPSVVGPVRVSTACSGCGMRPTTFPASLVMPAMSRREPLGLPSR